MSDSYQEDPRFRITVNPGIGSKPEPPDAGMIPFGVEDGEPQGGPPIPTFSDTPIEAPEPLDPDAVDFNTPYNPWDNVAPHLRSSVKRANPPEEDSFERLVKGAGSYGIGQPSVGKTIVDTAQKAPGEFLKSIEEAHLKKFIPEGAASIGDDGEFYDKDGNHLPATPKLPFSPVTRNAQTGELEPQMPGALDVLLTPGGTGGRSAQGAVFGAGPVFRGRRPGVGHNQGPPLPPATAGAPGAVPPGGVPPGAARQIVAGHTEDQPFSFHTLYTQTIDDLHPLKQLEKEIQRTGAPLGPDEQAYKLARLTRGTYGRTQQMINHGTFDFHTLENNGPGLVEVLKPVTKSADDVREFEDFAVAMRDIELQNRGIETGRPLAEAQQIVNQASPEMRQAMNGLHGYQDRVLQYMVDSGVVSQEAADNMRRLNQQYVPFHRLMDPQKDLSVVARSLNVFNPIKGMTGSTRDILSPIETIIRNSHYYIDLAEKNRAMQALERATQTRGLTGLMNPVPRGTRPITVTMNEVERFMQSQGVQMPPGMALAPDNFAIFRPNPFKLADDQVVVFRDGKPHVYQVDPEVANAVQGMGEKAVDLATQIASTPARWLRAGVVFSPDFMAKNPARDQLTATVQSTNFYVPVMSWLEGIGHVIGHTKTWQDFLKSGGANSNFVSMDRKYLDEMVTNLTRSGVIKTVKNVLNPMQLARILSEAGEQGTRVGEFSMARRRGKGKHESSYDAREVATDFARHGQSPLAEVARRTVPFFSPTIQGVDRFMRAAKDNPAAMAFKLSAFVVAPTLATYAYNRQDPRMGDVPDYESMLYWQYPTDKWVGVTPEEAEGIPDSWLRTDPDGSRWVNMGEIYKVPKNFEIGVYFGSIPEMMLDSYFKRHPDQFKTFVNKVTGKPESEVDNSYFHQERQPFKNLGHAMATVMPNFVPQVVLTPMEIAANHSMFRGRKIVPDSIANPENRRTEHTHYTTETAKYLGKAVGKIWPTSAAASPMMIEYGVRGWGGTIGMHILELADKAIKGHQWSDGTRTPGLRSMITGEEEPVEPDRQWADIPAMRAFVSRMPTSAAKHISDFYDNYDSARKSRATVRRLGREFGEEAANELRSQSTEISLDLTARSIANQMRFIRMIQGETKKRPIDDKEMTPDGRPMTAKEKRHFIDRALLNINMQAQLANRRYAEAKARKGGDVTDLDPLPSEEAE